MHTTDYTFSYRSKKFICTCAELSTRAHGTKSEAEILLILNQSWDLQGNGHFAI